MAGNQLEEVTAKAVSRAFDILWWMKKTIALSKFLQCGVYRDMGKKPGNSWQNLIALYLHIYTISYNSEQHIFQAHLHSKLKLLKNIL